MKYFPKVSLSLFILLTSSLTLSACNQTIEIRNGEIPNEFLPHIQRILGNYHGQMSLRDMDLRVALDGNVLKLLPSDDLVGPRCQSVVGDLLRVSYKQDTDKKDKEIRIQDAVFAIDPNLCSDRVEGRELHFTLISSFPILWKVQMVDRYDEYRDCQRNRPLYSEEPGCPWTGVVMYKTGKFVHE
jgi:hypothetical protein